MMKHMPSRFVITASVLLLIIIAAPAGAADPTNESAKFDPKNFDDSTTIDNPWWPLTTGKEFISEGVNVEDGEKIPHRIVCIVTDLTKVISNVRAKVIWERDFTDDALEESELVFFAQDKDGNVWHLGQYREMYEGEEFAGGRAWLVGIPDGAKAGIMMPARPQSGTPAFSEGYAPPPFHWTDSAQVYQTGQKTSVAAGDYDDVLVMEEWDQETPKGAFQLKYYARGVGIVRVGWLGPDPEREEMELIKVSQLSPERLAEARVEALKLEERAYLYGRTAPAEPISQEAKGQ